MLSQRILVLLKFAKKERVVSSLRFQKEHTFVSILHDIKIFYLNTTHCVIFCIENSLVLNQS